MTTPSHPPVAANLKPYTVAPPRYSKVCECDVYDILLHGQVVPSLACFTRWQADDFARDLNAAYTKGREDEGPIVEAAHEVRLNLATLSIEAQRDANYNGWLTKLRQALDERANPPKSAPPS